MTDLIWVALITALPPTIAAIAAWRQAKRSAVAVHETQSTVQETHTVINSRLDQLLEATRQAAHAVGMIAGRKLAAKEEEARKAALPGQESPPAVWPAPESKE